MKAGLYGQQLTLMEELKAATLLPHARLQTTPFFQALETAPARFPAQWIAAIESTLARARQQARRTASSSTNHP
jgi:hypothetical protein